MKRIALALLSIFIITPGMANIHIRSEVVETVIKQKISDVDAQIAALAEYNAQVKNAGGTSGIPAAGIWSVCTAAGWDTKTTDGKTKCTDFGNTLMKYANWQFRAVCDKDKFLVERGTGRCIDNVFSNKVLGGTKVNTLIATGLAKEYARVKHNDNNLVCSKNIRKTTLPPDDYVQCMSMDKNMAYEFRFDSVTATKDAELDASTESGVCKIYGVKYSASGVSPDTAYSRGETWPAACETTDAGVCARINESMSRFGRSAKIGSTGARGNQHSACVIKTNAVSDISRLRTAFGIDNMAFKNGGIQLNAGVAVKTQVCDWVRKTVTNPSITSCACNDGITKLYDFSSLITETDDVLTCTINGKPVDFVFDDLSESNKKVAAGGAQGMDCMAAGGTYSGQRCINLDSKQCELLARANLKNCPSCKRVKFDPQTKSCVLPSSADAANIQKNTNIALIIGGAVVGVGVTVMTGGAGAVVVLTGIETVGAAIEMGAQLKIDAIADEFLVKSNQCKSASCAKSLIENNFQHLADSQNDFSAPEISAIDSEMARLAEMIPENDDFWADMALSGLTMADNQSGVFDFSHWTPEQWWRAAGITLQMASVVTSVGKWVGTKTKTMVTKLSKSSEVLKTKTEKVVDVVEKAQEGTLSGNRLELKRKIAIMRATDSTAGMSDIDKEWELLRKAYAPRNENLEHFKATFDGNIQRAREETKKLVVWNYDSVMDIQRFELNKLYETRPDILEYVRTHGFDAGANEFPEFRAILESSDSRRIVGNIDSKFEAMLKEYAQWEGRYSVCGEDPICLADIKKHLDDLRKDMNSTPGFQEYITRNPGGNYSTWDPNIRKIEENAQQQIAERNKAMDQLKASGITDEDEVAKRRADIKAQTTDKALYEIRDNISMSNIDDVALLRADQIHDIIESDPWLKSQKERWYKMTTDEKVIFAQDISDRLLEKNGVSWRSAPQIFSEKLDPGVTGTYSSSLNRTDIDFEQVRDYENFINTLAHENGGHAIDYLNPNAGAVGTQLQNASKSLFGEAYDAYRAKPTEQTSWRIGDVASVVNTFHEKNLDWEDLLLDVVSQKNVGITIWQDGGNVTSKYNSFGELWTDLFDKQKNIDLWIRRSEVENADEVINAIKESGKFRVVDVGDSWFAFPIK